MTICMDAIEAEVAAGYVNKQKHATADLYIYNYSQRAQFEWHWNDTIKQCRGLIVSGDGEVVARPFPKFFSYEQLQSRGESIPTEPFQVFDKLDGSLGVCYWLGNVPQIATRGAFHSDQAKLANSILENYHDTTIPTTHTLLFEIIHPSNRIVVDYGEREELVLLAAVDTETGDELPYEQLSDFGFPVVQRFDYTDIGEVLRIQNESAEGFVIRFESGFRVKIKFDEYKRLHKLLTGITPRMVWENLRAGKPLSELADRVPDEFYSWLQGVERHLNGHYLDVEAECLAVMRTDFTSRREAAEYFKSQRFPSIMFLMYDGKPYSDSIWKLCYPPASKAFKCDEEFSLSRF